VSELDGVWALRRAAGLLPPLDGVRKRIAGNHGVTLAGRLRGVPFDVVDLELRYRPPFTAFVDVLSPSEDGFAGRATFLGREYGRFEMTPIPGGAVESLNEQLIKHIDECHALEQGVLRLLDAMIQTTDDADIVRELEHHRIETEGHADRMRRRLEAHGTAPSAIRQAGGILGALAKVPIDVVRGEKTGRNARDGYMTEHLEIASYELLKRIAERAGDDETVAACDAILAEEEAMAKTIAASWDRFAELSLRESGIPVT
jgi:ferritin-like metal-binding protein YciE